MHRPASASFAFDDAIDVSHAAHVVQRHNFGSTLFEVLYLAFPHGSADIGVLDREQAAKTTALSI